MASNELLSTAEAARILGITRRQVLELAASTVDLPQAEPAAAGGRRWPRAAIEAWRAAHPDRGRVHQGPELPPVGRWSPQVAKILDLAAADARGLRSERVSTSHLLSALVHPDCPGLSRDVLRSFGVTAERLRHARQRSFVDPVELESPEGGGLQVDPATRSVLERAQLEAFLLADAEVSSEHVLLALASHWAQDTTTTALLRRRGLDPAAVPKRVLDLTEDLTPLPAAEPPEPELDPEVAMRRWVPELDLAPTPDGGDPRRRMPWGSVGFVDADGKLIKRDDGRALRQYFVDRDGNPVLTADGRPIHYSFDEHGKPVLNEDGFPLIGPVDIPAGSTVHSVAQS